MMNNLLIVHHRHEEYRKLLSEQIPELNIDSFDFRTTIPFDQHDAEILICWKIPDGLLERLPNLRWIAAASAGVEHILDQLRDVGDDVIVSRASATMGQFMAQYCLQHILNHIRKYQTVLQQREEKTWRFVMGDLLERKTALIIGLGNIGSQIAKTLSAVGMKVLGAVNSEIDVDDPRRLIAEQIVHGEQWRNVLPRADFVILTVPTTPETAGMFGNQAFKAMNHQAVLVNISRGAVVDEKAMIHALENNRISGAVLDVFNEEPLPEHHPLWEMKNVVITPHCSGPSEDEAIIQEFIQDYKAIQSGGMPGILVRLERGY